MTVKLGKMGKLKHDRNMEVRKYGFEGWVPVFGRARGTVEDAAGRLVWSVGESIQSFG